MDETPSSAQAGMAAADVSVVHLPPSLAASAWAYGAAPEAAAHERMQRFLATAGLTIDGTWHRLFGFDNPPPGDQVTAYGYEVLATLVDGDLQPDESGSADHLRLVFQSGGLYARLPFQHTSFEEYGTTVPAAWRRLHAWVQGSDYRPASHACYEESNADGEIIARFAAICA